MAIPVTADQAFFGEVIGTLLLVLAVLFCTDTARSMEHPHMTALIPLTIGLVVLIDHLALIPIDGCSVNPARSLGSAIVYGSYDNIWVFIVGPFVGAIFATVVYKLIFGPTEVNARISEKREGADVIYPLTDRPIHHPFQSIPKGI